MYATEKEPSAGYYVQEITSNYILYKKSSEEARKKYLAYHSALDPEADERLNRALCLKVMNDLLLKSIKKADNRMRDALGTFYNISQGVNGEKYPLTSENVRFVKQNIDLLFCFFLIVRAPRAQKGPTKGPIRNI